MSTHRLILGISIVGIVIGLALYFFIPSDLSRIRGVSTYSVSEILSLVNAARQSAGLTPLHPNDQLTQAAESKATAMITAKSWSHNTPDQTPWQFLDQAGYVYAFAGENLAKNFVSAPNVIDAWLASPSHRANLLSPNFTETGVAILPYPDSHDNSVLIVQYLAKPVDNSHQASNETVFNSTDLLNNTIPNSQPFLIAIGLFLSAIFSLILFKFLHHPKSMPAPASHHWLK